MKRVPLTHKKNSIERLNIFKSLSKIKLIFTFAALSFSFLSIQEAYGHGYTSMWGSGYYGAAQACPYDQKSANLRGENALLEDANTEIARIRRERAEARSYRNRINADIRQVEGEVKDILKGFAFEQFQEHVKDDTLNCKSYERTCNGITGGGDSELDGGPTRTRGSLIYDIESLVFASVDYIARLGLPVANADGDACLDIQSASIRNACDAACGKNGQPITQSCAAPFIQQDQARRQNQQPRAQTPPAQQQQQRRGNTRVACQPNQDPARDNCYWPQGLGYPVGNQGGGLDGGAIGSGDRQIRRTDTTRTSSTTTRRNRCSFEENERTVTEDDLMQAHESFCGANGADLWEQSFSRDGEFDVDKFCKQKALRQKGESASDCRDSLEELLALYEELENVDAVIDGSERAIRTQERLKRSLTRQAAREERERRRDGITEADSYECTTGKCGNKGPSQSTLLSLAAGAVGGYLMYDAVNSNYRKAAESHVRLGHSPAYLPHNSAVNTGLFGGLTIGAAVHGLTSGAYACAGAMYPHGANGMLGPYGHLGVDPTLGGALGYPPWIYGGNPLGIPGMGGIVAIPIAGGLAGYAGGYPGGLAGYAGGYPGGIISAIAGGYPGGLAGYAGGFPGGLAGYAGGYPGGIVSAIAGGYPGGLAGYAGGFPGGLAGYAGGFPGGLAGYAGGFPGGLAGYAGGYPGAIAGGIVGAIAGGYPGGLAGYAGGYPGGLAGYTGIAGGIAGAIAGGYPGGLAGYAGGFPGGLAGYAGLAGGYPGGLAGYAGGYPGGFAGYTGIAGAGYPGGIAGAAGVIGGAAGGQYQQQWLQLQQQQLQLQIQQQQRAQQDYIQRMNTVGQLQNELYRIQAQIQQIVGGGGIASANFNLGVSGQVGIQGPSGLPTGNTTVPGLNNPGGGGNGLPSR